MQVILDSSFARPGSAPIWGRKKREFRDWTTGEVPQSTSSHLATIVSRALQPQDGRIPCPVDRNLEIFLTSHVDFLFVFGQCGDNCK